LRRQGVVGKYVEFCGPGIAALSLADRATVSLGQDFVVAGFQGGLRLPRSLPGCRTILTL
jgi:hypothetical protein